MNTWKIIILAIIGVLVLGGVSYGAYLYREYNKPIVESTITGPDSWQIYKNNKYGFELKYPENWRTAQCGIDCQGFGPQNVGEDTAIAINILNSKLEVAKKSLPVLGNSNNKLIKEEIVVIEGAQWTKLTIKQDISEEIFIEHLIEKNGKTYDLGAGTDESNIVDIYNQILSTFKLSNS